VEDSAIFCSILSINFHIMSVKKCKNVNKVDHGIWYTNKKYKRSLGSRAIKEDF